MSKTSGLGDQLYVAGYDLSGDTGALSRIGGGPALIEMTGIDKSAHERFGGARSGGVAFTGFFNDAAGQSHPVLSALPTADVELAYFRGSAIGNAAAGLIAKQINYDMTRGPDGSLSLAVEAQSNAYGIEFGRQLTAGQRTDTGATNGTGYDGGAASAFGLQAYLQVFAFTGTDATVKLQESSDDGGGDAYADVTGGGFTAITSAPTSERIATAAGLSVERYLRVATTTSGGFTALTFAVLVVRNAATPEF